MEEKLKSIIQKLTEKKETISTMESCTGGELASTITNIEGASEVIKFSAVTYSNEFKIKMGVSKNIIDEYSVYSVETAKEMSKKISDFASSTYGVGITGKLNRVDKNNKFGQDNVVFVSIYDSNNDKYHTFSVEVEGNTRIENKKEVINKITYMLGTII